MKNAEKKRCHKKMAITIAMVDFENLSNFLCLKSLGQGVFQSWNNKCCVKKKIHCHNNLLCSKNKENSTKNTNLFLSDKRWEFKNYIFFDNISTYSLV